jgi:hypothetical protein
MLANACEIPNLASRSLLLLQDQYEPCSLRAHIPSFPRLAFCISNLVSHWDPPKHLSLSTTMTDPAGWFCCGTSSQEGH